MLLTCAVLYADSLASLWTHCPHCRGLHLPPKKNNKTPDFTLDFGHSWMLTQVILLIILMIILTTFTMCFSGGTVTLQSLSKAGFVLTSNVAWHCNWSGPKQRLWELGGRERRWNRNRRWGIVLSGAHNHHDNGSRRPGFPTRRGTFVEGNFGTVRLLAF